MLKRLAMGWEGRIDCLKVIGQDEGNLFWILKEM